MNSNQLFLILMNFSRNNPQGILFHFLLFFLFVFSGCTGNGQNNSLKNDSLALIGKDTVVFIIENQTVAKYQTIEKIPLPNGFLRIKAGDNSFAYYLRNLELKTENNTVHLFDGSVKPNQYVHFAIIKMDAGTRDLQQCADAVMRLRGEYLWHQKRYKEIHFNFLGDGKPRFYTEYAGGDFSYKKFRKYMDYIFAYANTSSLKDELVSVKTDDIMPGDVFIQKGSPYGHAVIVADVAVNQETGKKLFLIAQSFMPAQEIHILINENNTSLSPWYDSDFGETLVSPQWVFNKSDLMRFK
jgi:hypothetical protein